MDEAQLLQLLADAQDALARGAPYNDINARIRAMTDGQFAGMMALTVAIDPQAEADRRLSESADGNTPTGDFMRMMAQGATFGFADEITGLFGGDVEESRARVERLREQNPVASGISEVAGILTAPAAISARAFQGLKGAGGILRSARAGIGTGAVEGALAGAGEGQGGIVDRAGGAATGGAAGAFTGGLLSGGGAVVGRLAKPFRPNASLAREALGDIVAESRVPPGEIAGRVAAQGPGGIVADVDPSIAGRLPGITRQAPQLRRAGGPVERLGQRIDPDTFRAAKRAIFEPLEQVHTAVDDKPLIRLLRNQPTLIDATRGTADIEKVSSLSFRQLQDIRAKLKKGLTGRNVLPSQYQTASDALTQFDNAMDTAVPGFREARRRFAQTVSQHEDWERLFKAVDKAIPPFRPDLPNRIEGLGASVRNVLTNQERRRSQIAEIVGEVLMAEGREGAERLEQMIASGFFARAFGGVAAGARVTATTQTGRAFGGGLLSGGTREER